MIINRPGIHAVMIPSITCKTGTNFPSFLWQISYTKEDHKRIAHKYQNAAQRQSGVIPRAELPVINSIVPKTMALTATKVENQAKGMGLNFHSFIKATKIYVKTNKRPVPAAY